MFHHALPLTPMQPNRHTGTRPFRTVKHRPLDRTAYLVLTIVIGKGVEPVERERPAAPGDADVVATWVKFIAAAAVHLGARAEVTAFAGVVCFAIGADPAIVGAFLEGGLRGVGGGGEVGGISGRRGGGGEGESACAQEGEEDGLELHFGDGSLGSLN